MNSYLSVLVSFSLLILAFSCSKKVQPETTLNRGGVNTLGNPSSPGSGFNEGTEDLAGLGDPLTGSFDEFDPLAPRDSALSGFDDPLNVIRPFDPVFFWL